MEPTCPWPNVSWRYCAMRRKRLLTGSRCLWVAIEWENASRRLHFAPFQASFSTGIGVRERAAGETHCLNLGETDSIYYAEVKQEPPPPRKFHDHGEKRPHIASRINQVRPRAVHFHPIFMSMVDFDESRRKSRLKSLP